MKISNIKMLSPAKFQKIGSIFFQSFFNISKTAWNFNLKFSANEQNLFRHIFINFWVHTIYGWWRKHFLCHVIGPKNNVYIASKNCYKTCSTCQIVMKLCKVLDIRLIYFPTNFHEITWSIVDFMDQTT